MISIFYQQKKKHKSINEKFNLIGSIEISKDNPYKEIVLYNLLVNQTKPLNGLYVHLNLIDYPNKEKDLELSFQSLLLEFFFKNLIRFQYFFRNKRIIFRIIILSYILKLQIFK